MPDKLQSGAAFVADQRKGVIALLLSTTGMGLTGLLTRGATRPEFFGTEVVAGEPIGAFMTLGRMVCALIVFAIMLIATHRARLFRDTRLTSSIILGGLCVGIAMSLYMVSTLLTTLADAIFLIYTGPLFCTILARIFRRERIDAAQWICLLFVFAGMLLTSGMVSLKETGISFGFDLATSEPGYPKKGLGDALGLLSGLFYGASLFFNGYRKDCDSIVRGVWNFAAASVGSLVVACVLCAFWPLGEVTMDPANWGFAFALWMICGPFALGLLLVAGRNLPAVEYSTIAYWECVVSLLVSALVYQEPLSSSTIVGGAFIVAGGMLPALRSLLPAKEKPCP
ncbi:MAG: DMT family transporter [Eggerthellaceae bacterium]|nr:DMT family transporter [Eggerthellaceae bacterium]